MVQNMLFYEELSKCNGNIMNSFYYNYTEGCLCASGRPKRFRKGNLKKHDDLFYSYFYYATKHGSRHNNLHPRVLQNHLHIYYLAIDKSFLLPCKLIQNLIGLFLITKSSPYFMASVGLGTVILLKLKIFY